MEIMQNQSLQDYHALSKWKLSKISAYKITTSSQVNIIENQSFQDQIAFQSETC